MSSGVETYGGTSTYSTMFRPSKFNIFQALVFLREFVLGSNKTGLVLNPTTVIGGENSTLAEDVLPGGTLFYYGSATTAGTSTVPAATVAAWQSYIATATATNV